MVPVVDHIHGQSSIGHVTEAKGPHHHHHHAAHLPLSLLCGRRFLLLSCNLGRAEKSHIFSRTLNSDLPHSAAGWGGRLKEQLLISLALLPGKQAGEPLGSHAFLDMSVWCRVRFIHPICHPSPRLPLDPPPGCGHFQIPCPSSLALEKATHCSESPQQLRIGETDEGERHDEAEDEEEPCIVLAAVLGAHSVPVRATGALQALGDEPANRPNIHYTSIILGSEETL